MTLPTSFKKIPIDELRDKFNRGRFPEKAAKGELTLKVLKERKPAPGYNQPPGTVSQIVGYFDTWHRELAAAHQYVLPDKTIGASGEPDPIRVFDVERRVVYVRAE